MILYYLVEVKSKKILTKSPDLAYLSRVKSAWGIMYPCFILGLILGGKHLPPPTEVGKGPGGAA